MFSDLDMFSGKATSPSVLRAIPSSGPHMQCSAFGRQMIAWARCFCTSNSTEGPDAFKGGFLGFIGVGNMGGPMAANLIKSGAKIIVYDRNPTAIARMEQLGAKVAESPKSLAETAGVRAVVSMLPSTEHVLDAYEGPEGLMKAEGGLHPSLFIDASTILPTYATQLEAKLARMPLASDAIGSTSSSRSSPLFVDAPVSGGVPGATQATLTFMCGGKPEAVAAARPLLQLMGQRIVHMGSAGLGQVAKICNNLAMAVEMAGVSEALALGRAVGMDPAQLTAVLNASSARCWSSEVYNPTPGVCPGSPASNDYKGGFSSALMLKDLRLAMQLATSASQPVPMGERASQLYQQVVDASPEPVDFSGIYRYVYGGTNTPAK